MRIIAASLVAIALTVTVRPALAHDPSSNAPPPAPDDAQRQDDLLRTEESAIRARQEKIRAELKAIGDGANLKADDWAKEWAGRYYTGDGLGQNVSIVVAPKSGIAYTNYGCLGLYGGDHGDIVEVLPDGLRVKLKLGSANGSYLDDRLYFVRWGDQKYLVPASQMLQFVNNYNEGGFGRQIMFNIARKYAEGEHPRRFGGDVPAERPQLPAEFAELLRDGPLKLKVISVTPVKSRTVTGDVIGYHCSAEFEGGKDQGVYVGMEFWYGREANPLVTGKFQVTAVTDKTCSAHITAFGDKANVFKPPVVGEVIDTSEDKATPPPNPADPAKPADAPKK